MRERSPDHQNMTILAGDIGGTNSRFAIYRQRPWGIERVNQQIYPSEAYGGVADIVSEFLSTSETTCDLTCLGLPGPVCSESVVDLTNLPWRVDKEHIRQTVRSERVDLINDVEASAVGVHAGRLDDYVCLREGQPDARGMRAVISLGTGLGVAGLTPSGRAHATEAGHTTFSPRTDFDLELLRALSREFGHVSWERVASGPALRRIHSLVKPAAAPPLDAPEIVGGAESDSACQRTVKILGSYIGAIAGNVALTLMATGGIFLCGGVAPRVVDSVGSHAILEALVDKGRMRSLLERIPVYLVRDDCLALTGAAHTALRRVEGA